MRDKYLRAKFRKTIYVCWHPRRIFQVYKDTHPTTEKFKIVMVFFFILLLLLLLFVNIGII
jgi:hypothetical protein